MAGPVAVALVSTLLLASSVVPGASFHAPSYRTLTQFDAHISHIVFVVLENHAYDSYFGTYCQTPSKYCRFVGAGIPAGTCVPYYPTRPSVGCVRPFDFTLAQMGPPDMDHFWPSTHRSIDNGSMDGFFVAEGSSPETFGHYNGTTAPVYWDLAEQYGLADDFFSSAASYSLSNHWFVLAPSAPYVSEQEYPQIDGVQIAHAYLNQSNRTTTIESTLLNNSGVSWTYYDWSLPASYAKAIAFTNQGRTDGKAYDLWSPLAARAQTYSANLSSHFVPSTQFASDAANGTLPNLSWVIPPVLYSDHPPFNITAGQNWVASLADALEASPEWNSSVMFVTWDEYGGFYDHVAPPVLDSVGDGLRVPMLAIGPWVKQGFIDHAPMDFDSVLHLMEDRFSLGCLGPRDCNATLPLAMFDFNRTPRAPILISPWDNATYPEPLQSSGRLPPPIPGELPQVPAAPEDPYLDVEFAAGGLG